MYFSLKDSLIKLQERNYDTNVSNTLSYLIERFTEDQLRVLSQQGLRLNNNILKLYFIENVGFRCMNERVDLYGRLPICKNIENYMNSLYLDYINKSLG